MTPAWGARATCVLRRASHKHPPGFGVFRPRPGEHTRILLREAGLDDSEIDALVQSGAVEELTADD